MKPQNYYHYYCDIFNCLFDPNNSRKMKVIYIYIVYYQTKKNFTSLKLEPTNVMLWYVMVVLQ